MAALDTYLQFILDYAPYFYYIPGTGVDIDAGRGVGSAAFSIDFLYEAYTSGKCDSKKTDIYNKIVSLADWILTQQCTDEGWPNYGGFKSNENSGFYYSVDACRVLPALLKAYELTGDSDYLAAAVIAGKDFLKFMQDKQAYGGFARFLDVSDVGPKSPSTVSTSTEELAVRVPSQRKMFYASGRFWVFYSDGTNIQLKTSSDGITWSEPTLIEDVYLGLGAYFAICYDGTYIHYVRTPAASLFTLKYRRGMPNSDGIISWSEDEQTVTSGTYCTNDAGIAVDSDGYPWVTWADDWVTMSYVRPYVTTSTKNDGTWTTKPGYPMNLAPRDHYKPSPVSLENGKIYVVYAHAETAGSPDVIYGRLYNGSDWEAEEQVSTSNMDRTYFDRFCVLNIADDVHVVFLKDSANDIIYVRRSWGVGWGSEVTVHEDDNNGISPVMSYNPSTNDLYCFWGDDDDHIYYKRCHNGVWASVPTDLVDESVNHLTREDDINCFFQVYDNKIGICYMTKTASPYNIRFVWLSEAVLWDLRLDVECLYGLIGLKMLCSYDPDRKSQYETMMEKAVSFLREGFENLWLYYDPSDSSWHRIGLSENEIYDDPFAYALIGLYDYERWSLSCEKVYELINTIPASADYPGYNSSICWAGYIDVVKRKAACDYYDCVTSGILHDIRAVHDKPSLELSVQIINLHYEEFMFWGVKFVDWSSVENKQSTITVSWLGLLLLRYKPVKTLLTPVLNAGGENVTLYSIVEAGETVSYVEGITIKAVLKLALADEVVIEPGFMVTDFVKVYTVIPIRHHDKIMRNGVDYEVGSPQLFRFKGEPQYYAALCRRLVQ